ncbi:hypothetical protein HQ531_01460 [bacterium]|nr:hypothetical protein [bacterium]
MPELSFNCPNCGIEITTQSLKTGEMAQCDSCKHEAAVPQDAKKTILPNEQELGSTVPTVKTKNSSTGRYPALTIISFVYKIAAGFIIFMASGVMLYGLSLLENSRSASTGLLISGSALIIGGISAVSLYAVSELLKLVMDIESNSRKQNRLLEKILNK